MGQYIEIDQSDWLTLFKQTYELIGIRVNNEYRNHDRKTKQKQQLGTISQIEFKKYIQMLEETKLVSFILLSKGKL